MGHYLSEMLHPEPYDYANHIHIIHSRNKWGVYKRDSHKSLKNFKHRDLAFHYAATKFTSKIVVHNTDGEVDFTIN